LIKDNVLKKVIKVFFLLLTALVIVSFVILLLPRSMPTTSTKNRLTIVLYNGGGGFSPNEPLVTLSQVLYNNNAITHTLEIKNGVHQLEPQSYNLPNLHEGVVTVDILWGDIIDSSFTLIYDDAIMLYNHGLLIYLAYFDDFYIYFISGSNIISYSRQIESNEWIHNTNPPRPRKIPQDDESGRIVPRTGWERNYWISDEET